jgi:hypothetical protein
MKLVKALSLQIIICKLGLRIIRRRGVPSIMMDFHYSTIDDIYFHIMP